LPRLHQLPGELLAPGCDEEAGGLEAALADSDSHGEFLRRLRDRLNELRTSQPELPPETATLVTDLLTRLVSALGNSAECPVMVPLQTRAKCASAHHGRACSITAHV